MRLLPIDSFKRSILWGTTVSFVLSLIPALYLLAAILAVMNQDTADAQSGLIVVIGPIIVISIFSALTIVITAACEVYRSLKYRKQNKYWPIHFAGAIFIVLITIPFAIAVFMLSGF